MIIRALNSLKLARFLFRLEPITMIRMEVGYLEYGKSLMKI